MHGIPFALKDIVDVAGLPTTCHSRLMSAAPAARDAPVTTRLRDAGAVLIGKLALHEFAIGGPAFDLPWPPARNPWNTNQATRAVRRAACGAALAAGLGARPLSARIPAARSAIHRPAAAPSA